MRILGLSSVFLIKRRRLKSAGFAMVLLLSALPSAALDGSFCLLVMDAESFVCTPCLEPVLRLCRALPDPVQEERVRGILVINDSARNRGDDTHVRIMQKKLAGFMKANSLKFPVFLDRFQVFRGLGQKGIAAVLLDADRRLVKKYDFPLSSGQLDELLSLLLESRS